MDEDLKIVIASQLEADEEGSAQRIAAQLPNIAKLINAKSSIKVGIELDERGVQSQVQGISKQIGQITRGRNIVMNVDIGTDKVDEMAQRLKELKVPDSAIKTFRKNIEDTKMSVTDIVTSFDAMQQSVTAVITGVNKAGDVIRQTQGVKLVSDENGEIMAELSKDVVVYEQHIEKLAQTEAKRAEKEKRDNDARIAFLEEQKQALADIQAIYTGSTSVKPIKDDGHLSDLSVKYQEIENRITNLTATTGALDKVQRTTIEGAISELKRLVKEYQNVEYVATSLRTKSVAEVNNDKKHELEQYELRLKSLGLLTEDFQTKIEGLRTQLSTAFSRDSLVAYLDSFDRLSGEVDAFKEKMDISALAEKNTADMGRIETSIDLLNMKFDTLSSAPEELGKRITNLRVLFQQFFATDDAAQKNQIFKQLNDELSTCKGHVNDLIQMGRMTLIDPNLDTNLQKAKADLETVGRQWSALKKDEGLNHQFDILRSGLNEIKDPIALKNWRTEFNAFKSEVKAAGKNVMSLEDILKNNLSKVLQWVSATTMLFRAIRLLKSACKTIIELDTAMVDLRKVTGETEASYRKFYYTANETAKSLGVTTQALIAQTAEWARLGYTLKDAEKMAENSAIFTAISPELNMEESTDGLISIMKAFGYEADYMLDGVISKINKIGNEMAVSNKDLVEVMTRSSAAMSAANNSFEETIALATAATEITRDASSVGNALKTVSMRIRAIDEETEEFSSDLTEITGKVADLTKVASNGNKGISLFEPGDPNTYRSTYDILKDISKIWKELTDKNRADLLEVLFGKRQGQVGSAILSNFVSAEKAIEKMADANGNAMKEMEKVYDSLEYKLNQLKETWVSVSQNLVDDRALKVAVDGLTALSNIVDFLTEHLGLLGTIGVAGTVLGFMKLKQSVDATNAAIQPALQSLAGVNYEKNAVGVVKYASALSSLDPIQQSLVMSTKGLNAEQQKQVLNMMAAITAIQQMTVEEFHQATRAELNAAAGSMMTAELIRAALANGTLTEAALANVVATKTQTAAMAGLGVTAKTTTATVKAAGAAMMATPMGWITFLISVIPLAVTGISKLYDWLVVTAEEAYESAEEMRSSYEEVEKEIEDLNSEFQTSKTRISELQKLSDNGTITLVEQEELERLKRSNAELETTLARKKEIAALDAAEANKEYVNSYNKTTQGSNQQDVLLAESDAIWKANKDLLNRYQEYLAFPTEGIISDEELQRASELSNRLEEINQAISSGFYQGELLNEELSISEAVEQRVNTYNELAQLQESGVELSQAQKDLLESSRADLRNMAEKLDTDFLQKYIGEDANTEEWQRLLDLINKTIYASEYFNERLNELPKSCYQTMERLGKEAGLSAEKVNELANQYPELAKWMSDSGKTAEDVAAHFNALSVAEEDVGDQTGKTATALTTAITKLEALSGNVDTISKALGEFADDGIVSIDTLNGMSDELKNLSTFEEFANILSNSASSMDEVQEACNRLAEEYINTSDILDGVNEETAQVIEGHLSEMGVINAHEIVQARLNALKWEAKLAEEGLNAATWAEIEAHLKAAGAEATEIKQLRELKTAQYNAEIATTNFTTATSSQIGALISQANAAGVAAEKIAYLGRVQALIAAKEGGTLDKYLTELYGRDAAMVYSTESGFQSLIDSYVKKAQVDLSDVNVTVPEIKVEVPTGSSGSKKKIDEYLATIDRFREAQEQLRRAEEKREKIESNLENSGSLEERIRLRKELIQAYKDEQAALHNLNEQRDAAIKEDVSKLTQRGFEIEYDPDNNQFWVKNLERINSLTAKSKGKYDTSQEVTNAYRKETEELIKTLEEWNEKNRDGSNQWVEDELAKIAKIIEGYEDITKAYENEIAIRDKWVSDAAEKKDTAALEKSTREIVGYYKQMQQNIHEEANYYRSLGYSEDSDEVTALKTLWWDYAESIKDAKNNVIDYLTGLVEASNDAVDEIQGVYDTFHKAADEYAQSGGYITVDTFQEILALGPQYLQLLTDENGALVMEEEAIQKIIAARVEQLALENAMTYVERLRLAANGDSLESLNDLLYVTEENTDATWGFVKAKLALMKAKGELNTEQYEAALHNIEAMRVGAVNAIEGITKSVEGAGDLMKYVMDMMKSHIEQEIEGIERMKDEFAELIDLRKKALDTAKDEADYQKDIAAKTKEMAKLQARIDALSLDDSREAQAERAKLLEEMNGLQEDLNEKQADHAIDQQKEALDKMQKDYEETQDARIKDLEDSISSEQKLYDMAVNHIKSNWGSLLDELTNWNYQFGSDLTVEIESAWDKAIQAAQNYFSYVSGNDVTGKDYVKYYESTNQGGSGSTGSGGGNKNYTVADTKKTQDYSDLDMVHAIVARMKEYAAAWKPGDPTGEHSKAADEAARLPQYGVQAEFKNGSGVWEIKEDKFNPKNKGKNLYSVYHTGGIVGGGEIKANEKFALLKDKEWVLSEEMVDNLSKQMERINTLSEAFHELPQYERSAVLPELIKAGGSSTVNNVTNNSRPVEIHIGDTVIHGRADAGTVAAHQKISREQVNEIARMIGVRL